MDDYIERDAAMKVAQDSYDVWNLAMAMADDKHEINLVYKRQELCKAVEQVFKIAPTADVAQVRHGRWIKRGYVCGENEYECSECHETEWRTSDSRMKWCMFCGAKMDGGEKDETQNLCKTVDGSGPLPE